MKNSINVGRKLKMLRSLHKISLKKLAEETGMSYSYLWGLENDKHSISVTNLQRLSEYFDVDLIYFLGSSQDSKSVYIAKEDINEVITEDNVSFKCITDNVKSRLQVTLVELPKDSPSERHIHHHDEGEEFITVISGELHVILGDEEYELGPGDSVLFESKTDHVIFTKSKAATFYLVVTPPYGSHLLNGI
ncbi:cupin domain-containing protein [Clostridia bacterium]|nr:cupin domain-containing protein [Clostridia bacterium]